MIFILKTVIGPIKLSTFISLLLLPLTFARSTVDYSEEPCSGVTPDHNNYTMGEVLVSGASRMCCMCYAGYFMDKPCEYQKPATRTCKPCPFDPFNSNEQYFSQNQSHTQRNCTQSIPSCPVGFHRIPGSRQKNATCEEASTTVPPSTVSIPTTPSAHTDARDENQHDSATPSYNITMVDDSEAALWKNRFYILLAVFILVCVLLIFCVILLCCVWDQIREKLNLWRGTGYKRPSYHSPMNSREDCVDLDAVTSSAEDCAA